MIQYLPQNVWALSRPWNSPFGSTGSNVQYIDKLVVITIDFVFFFFFFLAKKKKRKKERKREQKNVKIVKL